jgi:VIT1/CCC1 family predicted Fe2+/Mn2+ transporter
LLKNLKKTQILGFVLIVLSWVFWGLILVVPFLELGLRTTSLAITILLIGSNIFWFGAILAGKELMPKIKLWIKNKIWPDKNHSI